MPKRYRGMYPAERAKSKKYVAGLKDKVNKTATKLNRLVKGIEHKFNYQTYGTPLVDTGDVQLLTGITQDDTQSGRTGAKVSIKKIRMRALFQNVPAGGTPANKSLLCRIIIFRDKQLVPGTDPSVSMILTGSDVMDVEGLSILQYHRFKVLKDKTFVLNPDNSINVASQAVGQKVIKMTIIPDIAETIWSSTTPTSTQKNHFFMLVISRGVTASTTMPVLINWCLDYTDL